MSQEEPDIRIYLQKVLKTVSAGMLFLLFHMTVGIYLNWGFFEGSIGIGNIVYYLFFLASLGGFIYYLLRVWRKG
jgi:hypothetical protein